MPRSSRVVRVRAATKAHVCERPGCTIMLGDPYWAETVQSPAHGTGSGSWAMYKYHEGHRPKDMENMQPRSKREEDES